MGITLNCALLELFSHPPICKQDNLCFWEGIYKAFNVLCAIKYEYNNHK